MQDNFTYTVISSGEIIDGFESPKVKETFANLFKITPDKAEAFFGCKKVLKKNLDLKRAHAYKQRLESIGMKVELKVHKSPSSESQSLPLALEPTEEEVRASKSQSQTESSSQSQNTIICPKCHQEQSLSEICEACGAVFSRSTATPLTPALNEQHTDGSAGNQYMDHENNAVQNIANPGDDNFDVKMFLAAAGAALLGALLWKGIALAFGYELGLIAWLIGGAVGFSAAKLGSSGQTAGIVCGILALLSILGGKYMTIKSVQTELTEIMSNPAQYQNEAFRQIYQDELAAAKRYTNEVDDENSLKQFIVDNNYSEYDSASQVTAEELNYFKEFSLPRLESFALDAPSFESWIESSFQGELENLEELSTFELMKEDMGAIYLLFLLFGVGTAFKLASGRESS